ncbi:MAG: hypothetical protein ACSHYA_08465 [Opitutaceae bacterium]
MRIFLLGALLLSTVYAVQAQEGLQPKYDISPSIAKVPEQSDFFGSWTRGDGGYTIEVATGSTQGSVVVKYFNPESINVESAQFELVEGEPLLGFVLRDEGYPGSAYQLSFLSERRVLVGTYARPGSEPSQVYFVNQAELTKD